MGDRPAYGTLGRDQLEQYADPNWRLSNLYHIQNDAGRDVLFVSNEVQRDFLRNLWYLSLILKARQEGITTLVDLVILDQCLWYENISAGIIAHTVGDALNIFEKKIRYPYRNLPEGLRATKPLVKDAQSDFRFANGSSISVGTSFRSGTLQFLHVSEFGKIAAQYPAKAIEIVTGSFNTIAPGQWIFVESTAEGRGGAFFNLCQAAQQARDEGKTLTELDFKFHFYAWWRKKSNRIDPTHVRVTRDLERYFARVEKRTGVKLDPEQRAWYQQKREQMIAAGGSGTLDGDALMKRENPSYPEEAFEAAVAGAYFAREMQQLRQEGRLRPLPIMKNVPISTFWDLGKKDRTALWFHQKVGPENRLVDYYENSGMTLEHYARVLQDKDYLYAKHWLPHDAASSTIGSKTVGGKFQSSEEQLNDLRVKPTDIVPRVDRLAIGLEACRALFPSVWIDPVRCEQGILHLDMYRKAWNETVGDWYDHPVEDEHVHGADAFRQIAQSGVGLRPSQVAVRDDRGRVKTRSWRTV